MTQDNKINFNLWCDCDEDENNESTLKEDNTCACGISKHHYHCKKCGKLTQIG